MIITDAKDIIERGFVQYSDFGAVGDGKHDDYAAIFAAHKFANENGLDVRADKGMTYYIHVFNTPVIVKTNTDFTGATLILDDTGEEAFGAREKSFGNYGMHATPLFLVDKDTPVRIYEKDEINELFPNAKIEENALSIPWLRGVLECKSLIRFTNENHRDFIRFGSNVNSGNPRTDCLLVNTDGSIDSETPVAFPFEEVTKIEIFRTDDKPITIQGGDFKTICCKVVEQTDFENKWRGYHRKFKIVRSNTTIKNMKHRILDEPDIPNTGYGRGEDGKLRQSYPYYGFVFFYNTYNSRAVNLALNAHTTYYEDKKTSEIPVPMGSYDLVIEYSSHVTCENITNGVDIKDTRYWGIMSSNGARNLTFKNCSMSRFDAHRGFWNARLIGCEFGRCINVIGGGTIEIIDTVRNGGNAFITLRNDYGASFKGNVIIKNCKFNGEKLYRGTPNDAHYDELVIIRAGYQFENEQFLDWDFGYRCYMPQNVYIENLETSAKTVIFNDIDNAAFDESHSNAYIKTKQITLAKNIDFKICNSSDCTELNSIVIKRI